MRIRRVVLSRLGLLLAIGLLIPTLSHAQNSNQVRDELLGLLGQYRASWKTGFVDATVSGQGLPQKEPHHIKVWWDGDKMRREHGEKQPKTLIYTRNWSGEFSDRVSRATGLPFKKVTDPATDTKPRYAGHQVLPDEMWLTSLGADAKPLEEWLVTRPVDPRFVKTPTGYAAILSDANDEDACASALKSGLPLESADLSHHCYIFSFNSNGLPVSFKCYGDVPQFSLAMEWDWTDAGFPILNRARKLLSHDSGETFATDFELVINQCSRTLPRDFPGFKAPH